MIKQIQKIRDEMRRRRTIRNSFIPHSVAIGRSKLKEYDLQTNHKNIVLGACIVGLGVITLPFPCGSLFIIAFGLIVIASPIGLRYLVRNLKEDIKFKLGLF